MQRWQDLITPGLRYSQSFYEDRLNALVGPGIDWLDLGCGHHILPLWRRKVEGDLVARTRSVTGLDYDLPSLRKHRSIRRLVRGDIGVLPFLGGSFDLVTANMVVEHLSNPERQFAEVARVLRPGGTFLIHTPNALGYPTLINRALPEFVKKPLIRVLDGRHEGDVFRTHYRANTRRRLQRLARQVDLAFAGFEVIPSVPATTGVPSLAALELLVIALTRTRPFRALRADLIAVLTKPERSAT